MKHIFLLLSSLMIWLGMYAQPQIELIEVATGITRPVDITHAGDDRVFIVAQHGYIYLLDTANNNHTLFLDIDARVRSNSNEQGLLGLAFHPNHSQNGYFYVNYTNNSGNTVVSRFEVDATDPNAGDPNSEQILLTYNQPYGNHNGGDVVFGPDGYLYISSGDGGSQGDPSGHAQNLNSYLGKILRIDVDNGSPYAIPADNPFVGMPNVREEVWAYGLRNPWRISFDDLTGDLWIGDVGQNNWEEIDFQPANSSGGENYGWRCREGNNAYNMTNCPPLSDFTAPAIAYENTSNVGCSVTGGMVYRGNDFPDLYGHYIYADYCTGRMWSLYPDTAAGNGWVNHDLGNYLNSQYSVFGADSSGNMYVAGRNNGRIYALRSDLCADFVVETTQVIEACEDEANGSIDLNIMGGQGNYTISWNHGPNTEFVDSLSAGLYSVTVTDENQCARTVNVVVGETVVPVPEITTQGELVVCEGGEILVLLEALNLPQDAGYQWYENGQPIPGENNPIFYPSWPGSYQVQFTGRCNSDLSGAIEIVEAISVVPIISATGDTLSVPPAVAYQWLFNGDTLAGATEQSLVATTSGTYAVLTVDSIGCVAISEAYQHIASSIETQMFQQLRLAPNPASNAVHLRATPMNPGIQQMEFRLLDAAGRELLQESLQVQGGRVSEWISLRAYPAGTYFVELRLGNQRLVKNLLLVK